MAAVIAPWNYPFAIPVSQIAPALVAGNAVVLKPSELTPAVGELLGELCAEAGLPGDLLQVVQGGADVGAAAVAAGPEKVFFTGSVAAGKKVAAVCAEKLIPSVLELGGKDAMIVCADADLEIASSAAVWGAFTNCGQACLSVARIYVQDAVAEKFLELVVGKTKRLKLGGPADTDAEIGPMIREAQVAKIEQQLREVVEGGAQVVAGGKRRPELGPTFFEPTVVTVRREFRNYAAGNVRAGGGDGAIWAGG